MKTKIIIVVVLLMLFSCLGLCQNNKVNWYSFNMGYGAPSGPNYIAKSVVGQVFVGTTSLSDNVVISGFLVDTLFNGGYVGVYEEVLLPTDYVLKQNYPNPWNPTTTIRYELPYASHVMLKVYNIIGQQVMQLVDEEKPAGYYEVKVDGSIMASGLYIYRLDAISTQEDKQTFTQIHKMLLLK